MGRIFRFNWDDWKHRIDWDTVLTYSIIILPAIPIFYIFQGLYASGWLTKYLMTLGYDHLMMLFWGTFLYFLLMFFWRTYILYLQVKPVGLRINRTKVMSIWDHYNKLFMVASFLALLLFLIWKWL